VHGLKNRLWVVKNTWLGVVDMEKTKVSIVKGSEKPDKKEIEAIVRKAIELVGGLDGVGNGDTVLIKPNIGVPVAMENATVTNPDVVRAIADMVKETGARAIIGESSGVMDSTESCIQATGYDKLRAEGYELIDLKGKKLPTVKVPVPKGKALKEFTLPKIVLDAKLIISVPVIKTHGGEKVTLALKNMKGVLPDAMKKRFHTLYGVGQGVVDLLTVVRPGLAVLDGIVAQEGLGPVLGTPVEMGLIIASKDPVAADAVASSVIGFDPREVRIIDGTDKAGIGTADLDKIEVVGTPIKEVQRRFKRVEEAVEETIPFPEGLRVLIDEKACTGCRGGVMIAIWDLKMQNKLDKLAGWTIVAGLTEEAPKADKDKLLLVGACTARYKKLGTYIKGCPPWPGDVTSVLTGEKAGEMSLPES
jgi:uncharacterized protein (DUF362 family)